jgi:response regulator RpfG family c-di-GMP phosphodiesterase
MQNHTLLIVGSNQELISDIKQKVSLRRDSDKILDTYLKGAVTVLKNCRPDSILFIVDTPDQAIIDTIYKIRENPRLKMTPVLFFIEKNYDKDFMLQAFSAGLDDFIYCPVDDTEVALRIKMNLKRNSYIQSNENQRALMRKFNIIDGDNFYMPEFTGNIFDVMAQNATEYNDSFIFMLLSSTYESKEKLLYKLRSNSRTDDVIGQLSENIFYIIMPKISVEKAKEFYKKVKESCEASIVQVGEALEGSSKETEEPQEEVSEEVQKIEEIEAQINRNELNAAVCKYGSKIGYKDFTTIVLKALKEASMFGNVLVQTTYMSSESFIAQVAQKKEKNYKIFQKVFDKKAHLTVMPTFQRLKTHLEQKYPYNVKFDFFTTESKCYFSLLHVPSQTEVAFKLNNLGHSKVSTETVYSTKEQIVTNTLEFDINDVTDAMIAKYINIITREFDRLLK